MMFYIDLKRTNDVLLTFEALKVKMIALQPVCSQRRHCGSISVIQLAFYSNQVFPLLSGWKIMGVEVQPI